MTKAASAGKTEVAVVENKALAVMPDFIDAADFGAGFEGTDKESFAIPFLQLLQKMSPLVDEDSPKYIPGAKAGMFFDTVSQKLYDGKAGLVIVPCAYKRSFIQWGARNAGGGFKGEYTPEQADKMVNDDKFVVIDGQIFKPNDDGTVDVKKNDYVADTRSHFILFIEPDTGEVRRAIFSLSSTLTKFSKMLL